MQLQGRKLAKECEDISPLVQPAAEVDVWVSCAQILYEKSDDILEPHLRKLVEWILDLNLPGASIIFDRLKVFSGEKTHL